MATKAGVLIDKLYQQDQFIDTIEAQLRKAKQKREILQSQLFNKFKGQDLHGARGKLALASIRETQHPKISNLGRFLKYVTANKAYELFQNRISSKAYFDRIEEGEKIGGVEIFTSRRISVTKTKR